MRVWRSDNTSSTTNEYQTDLTNIREVAEKFGRTEDTLHLYTDEGDLVAIATWPQGYKCYKYCYGKNLDPNPAWRVFIY